MRKIFIVLLFAIITMQLTAKDKVVVIEGFGAVVNGNKSLAEKDAVENALRRALEQAIGVHISASTVVENYQLVSDKIISKVKGYVKSYKVVSKNFNKGMMTVKVRVVVNNSSLKNDLQLITTTLERMKYPRVVIMVSEQSVGARVPSYWWGKKGGITQIDLGATETALTSALMDKNFVIVDRGVLMKNIKVSSAMKIADVSNQQALSITKNVDADIIITGKALAKNGGSVMGSSMQSVRANVNFRAIDLKTGRVIGTARSSIAKVHVDPITAGIQAMEVASTKSAQKLIKDMIKIWSRSLNNGKEIRVEVQNLKDSTEMFEAEKNIKSLNNVTAVILDKFENNKAVFRVSFRGDGPGLAQNLQGFNMSAVNITQKSITMSKK